MDDIANSAPIFAGDLLMDGNQHTIMSIHPRFLISQWRGEAMRLRISTRFNCSVTLAENKIKAQQLDECARELQQVLDKRKKSAKMIS
jgi:hypothetical protein